MLAADFIGRHNQVALSCADGCLTVWDLATYSMLRFVRMREVQVGLRYCSGINALASWGMDDTKYAVTMWNVDTLTALFMLSGGHSDRIRDVLELNPPAPPAKSRGGKGEIAWDTATIGELSLFAQGHRKPHQKSPRQH